MGDNKLWKIITIVLTLICIGILTYAFFYGEALNIPFITVNKVSSQNATSKQETVKQTQKETAKETAKETKKETKAETSSAEKDTGLTSSASATNKFVEGARSFLSTSPRYGSHYYDSGYPNDGYGVSTDVVAYACKNAGYDLMKLIGDDCEKNPGNYNKPGSRAIAFRRIRNQRVYFKTHATALTTSLSDTSQWKAGDIVFFDGDHVGILSDKVNADGLPYVLHFEESGQSSFEEDILKSREKKISAHYRLEG